VNKGFSRPDLVATLAVLMVTAGLMWPWIARSGITRQTVGCVDNLHQLMTAWALYANDSSGRIVNNFTVVETLSTVSDKSYENWAHTVTDWSTNPSNTNLALLGASRLFPYLAGNTTAFKCPSDNYLSPSQRSRGWVARVRSYSMSGFMGLTGRGGNESTRRGENRLFSGYRQFLRTSAIPDPRRTLVLLDEHPDSINDAGFFNPSRTAWIDLPASYHNGACGFAFADGHSEIKKWITGQTKQPVRLTSYGGTTVAATNPDLRWIRERTPREKQDF